MNDYETFCAKQRQVSETSWLEGLRERLKVRSGVTDIMSKRGGVLQPDPSLGHYPDSLPPVTEDALQYHLDIIVGSIFFLEEDLQCHNLDLTEEQHTHLLNATDSLARTLRGDWLVVATSNVDQ